MTLDLDELATRMRALRLLIVAGLLALLTACESLPDEKALAVNDPASFRAAPCGPIDASNGTAKRHAPKDTRCNLALPRTLGLPASQPAK
jgi:hypothetical protein